MPVLWGYSNMCLTEFNLSRKEEGMLLQAPESKINYFLIIENNFLTLLVNHFHSPLMYKLRASLSLPHTRQWDYSNSVSLYFIWSVVFPQIAEITVTHKHQWQIMFFTVVIVQQRWGKCCSCIVSALCNVTFIEFSCVVNLNDIFNMRTNKKMTTNW